MFSKEKKIKILPSFHDTDIVSKKSKTIPFSILGTQTFFQGKLILKGETRLAGQIEGTIISEDLLIIEESAHIKGELQGTIIDINGFFNGVIKATETLRVSPTAHIEGEIIASKLIVEEGATIKGKISSLEIENDPILKVDLQDINATLS